MFRCTKLKRLKRLRAMRDEILKTDNEGRAFHLLYNMPNVRRVTNSNDFGCRPNCEVEFNSGHEFDGYGKWTKLEAMRDVLFKVYEQARLSI